MFTKRIHDLRGVMFAGDATAMVEFKMRPLYSQVRDEIARRIAVNEYSVGALIPNEFVLSQEFRVSIGTVRKAVDMLSAEKALVRIQGRGTVVADRQSAEFRGLFDRVRNSDGTPVIWQFRHAEIVRRLATETEQRALQIGKGEDLVEIKRSRAVDGQLVMMELCLLPECKFRDIETVRDCDTTIECLAFARGIIIGPSEERIAICGVAAEQARELNLEDNTPVLRLDRLVYDSDFIPIEWRVALCHLADRFYVAPIVMSGAKGARAERSTTPDKDRPQYGFAISGAA